MSIYIYIYWNPQTFSDGDMYNFVASTGIGPLGAKASHNCDIIISTMASQITDVLIVYSIVCPGADQRNRQSPASLADGFPLQRASNAEMFDDVIMYRNGDDQDGFHKYTGLTLKDQTTSQSKSRLNYGITCVTISMGSQKWIRGIRNCWDDLTRTVTTRKHTS